MAGGHHRLSGHEFEQAPGEVGKKKKTITYIRIHQLFLKKIIG